MRCGARPGSFINPGPGTLDHNSQTCFRSPSSRARLADQPDFDYASDPIFALRLVGDGAPGRWLLAAAPGASKFTDQWHARPVAPPPHPHATHLYPRGHIPSQAALPAGISRQRTRPPPPWHARRNTSKAPVNRTDGAGTAVAQFCAAAFFFRSSLARCRHVKRAPPLTCSR